MAENKQEEDDKKAKRKKIGKVLTITGIVCFCVGFFGFAISSFTSVVNFDGTFSGLPFYWWILSVVGIFLSAIGGALQGTAKVNNKAGSLNELFGKLVQNDDNNTQAQNKTEIINGKCPNCSANMDESEEEWNCPYCKSKFKK